MLGNAYLSRLYSSLLVLALTLGSVARGGTAFSIPELFGPGNTVFRAIAKEPGASTQFIVVGRSWVGTQYQAILGGYLVANGSQDASFVANVSSAGKILKDFQSIGYDNLCGAIVEDGTNYYVACRSMKSTGYYDVRITKYSKVGTVISAFGTQGVLSTGIGGDSTLGHAFVRGMVYNSSASEIVIAGAKGFYAPNFYHPYVSRYDATTGAAKTDSASGDTAANSTSITNVSPTTNLRVGRVITGTTIPSNTTIVAVSGGTVTISKVATGTGTGVALTLAHTILSGIQATNTITADLNSTTTVTNMSSTASISPGQLVTGRGVPEDTTILSLSGSTMLLSKAATVSVSGTSLVISKSVFGTATAIAYDSTNGFYYTASTESPTFSATTLTGNTNSNTTLNGLSSLSGLAVGMHITGTNIPANTYISAISASALTISNAATATGTGITFTAMPAHNYYVHKFDTANLTVSAAPWGNAVDFLTAGGGTDSIPAGIDIVGTHVIAVGSNRINSSTPPWNCTASAHVLSTGLLDTTFGSVTITSNPAHDLKGVTLFSPDGLTPVKDCILNGIVRPASGTDVLNVGTVYNGTNYDPLAAKYDTNGALVSGFGTGGLSSTSSIGSYDEVLNAYSYLGGTTHLYAAGRGGNGTFTAGLNAKIDATTGGFIVSPQVTAITPQMGGTAGGTPVTITGSGFTSSTTSVTIGGTSCGSFVFTSATQVRCTTGVHSAATVDVVVTVGSETATLTNGFLYLVTPDLTSITPNVGTTDGGTVVFLAGTGFVLGVAVTIGGSSCTNLIFTDSTQIACDTPAHAAGAVNVVVINPDGQTGTLTNGFTYAAPPTVTSVSANFGPIAGGGTVTVNGTGFITGATIDFGGVDCGSVSFISSTILTCTLPAHNAGPIAVTVTNTNGGIGSKASAFTYWAAPTVTTITPAAGPTAGGTVVVIRGTNFQSAATVTVGGVNCGTLTINSTTKITCTTGAHSAAAVNVVVTSVSQSGTLTSGYTYQAAPAVTSDVSPSSGPVLGGTAVTITGTGFLSGATADFGGSACGSLTVQSATEIRCTTNSHANGAVIVGVINPDTQSGTRSNAYTYSTAAPTVSAITPSGGSTSGGTAVTITGTGFQSNTTAAIGGVNCGSLTLVNSTSITCTTGARAAATVDVVATTPSVGSGTLTNGFTYQAAPSVTSVSPNGGPAAGATPVTITGSNFTGASGVTFGGTACTSFTAVSDTSITCTAAAHSAGAVDVVVTATGTGTLNSGFTYRNAPTVSSVSPSVGILPGGTAVTITGTGFVSGATATFAGLSCTGLTFVSATSLTCTTPAQDTAGSVGVKVTNPDTQFGTKNAYVYIGSGEWLSTATSSSAARTGHTAIWTGSRMIIWGGFYVNTGGIYNPTTDSWTATSTTEAPSERNFHSAVWDGTRMIVWGGKNGLMQGLNSGGEYTFATDSWGPTGQGANVPAVRQGHTAVWTGTTMLVWGGMLGVPGTNQWPGHTNTGGAYNPVTKQWTATTTSGAPSVAGHTAVWNGSEMIAWGGNSNAGGKYNPASDTWTAVTTSGAPTARTFHTAVMIFGKMVVWGGYVGHAPSGGYVNSGGVYDPSANSWTSTSMTNAPVARGFHTAVVNSSKKMLVFGGNSSQAYLGDGGIYDPSGSGTWTNMTTVNAPTARGSHTAVYGAKFMIIWGGNTADTHGGRYYSP